jgi:hypothetical protein
MRKAQRLVLGEERPGHQLPEPRASAGSAYAFIHTALTISHSKHVRDRHLVRAAVDPTARDVMDDHDVVASAVGSRQ